MALGSDPGDAARAVAALIDSMVLAHRTEVAELTERLDRLVARVGALQREVDEARALLVEEQSDRASHVESQIAHWRAAADSAERRLAAVVSGGG